MKTELVLRPYQIDLINSIKLGCRGRAIIAYLKNPTTVSRDAVIKANNELNANG